MSKKLVMLSIVFVFCTCKVFAKDAVSESGQHHLLKKTNVTIDLGKENAGRRSVSLNISYPIGEGNFPLIVFSHGNALDNLSYHNLTDYWVENGYVVVAPLHLDSGGDMSVMTALNEKFGRDWVTASRVLELGLIIDDIDMIMAKVEGFEGRVVSDKVIAAGHSFGALSSQQLSGAIIEIQGDSRYPIPDTLVDDRVAAVVAVSPPGLIKGSLTEVTWQGYSTPQLVVTGTADFFPFLWPNYQDHFVSYLEAEQGQNYLLVLDGMDHYLGNLIGRLDREQSPQHLAMQNLQELSLLFIDHYLKTSKKQHSKESDINNVSLITKREGVLRYEKR